MSFADVSVDLEWTTPFQRALVETLRVRPPRRGRLVRRARGARRTARSGSCRGSARARRIASRSSSRATVSSPRTASAATDRPASRSSDGCLRSRASGCDHVGGRPRGARDDRTAARVRPARRALRALPRGREPASARSAESGRCTSTSGAVRRRAARFALLRESGLRTEIRTYRRRAFDTATRYQLHLEGTEAALARAERRPESSIAGTAPLDAAATPRRRA